MGLLFRARCMYSEPTEGITTFKNRPASGKDEKFIVLMSVSI